MTLYCDRIFWMSIIGTLIVLFVLCPVHCLCDNMVREFVNLMVIIAVSLILNFSISKKIMGHCSELLDNSMGIILSIILLSVMW